MIKLLNRYFSLNFKITFLISLCSFLLVGSIILIVELENRSKRLNSIRDQLKNQTLQTGRQVEGQFNRSFDVARNLSLVLKNAQQDSLDRLNREGVNRMLKQVLVEYQQIVGAYTLWEPYAFDHLDSLMVNADASHDGTGRFLPNWYKEGDQIGQEALLYYDEPGDGDYYLVPKTSQREAVIGPSLYPIAGKEVYLLSLVSPILMEDEFKGIVGVDLNLDWMDQLFKDVHKDEGEEVKVLVLNQEMQVAGVQGIDSMRGKDAGPWLQKVLGKASLQGVQEGQWIENGPFWVIFTQVSFSDAMEPWYLIQVVSGKRILKEINQAIVVKLLLAYLALALVLAFISWLVYGQLKPLKGLQKNVQKLQEGDLDLLPVKTAKDEIGLLAHSLEKLKRALQNATVFANQIGNNEFESSFEKASEQDQLGKALLEMRDKLKIVREEEEQRRWHDKGLSLLNEIIRRNQEVQKLAREFLNELLKYLGANQGALFLLEKEGKDAWLKRVATFAFDKEKFINQRLELGQGLAGQCALERKEIVLSDVPEDYVRIGSGLGDAKPRHVLVIPMLHNESLVGIIELASFHSLPEHALDWVKAAAENLAASIHGLSESEKTRELLELSQQQAEEMKSQEEEMRQNMEELQATQEELERRLREQEQTTES